MFIKGMSSTFVSGDYQVIYLDESGWRMSGLYLKSGTDGLEPDKKEENKEEFEREAHLHEKKRGEIPLWGWVVIAVVVILGTYSSLEAGKRSMTCPWEMNALFSLRALSNVELAYRDFNIENNFGTLDALKAHGFIKENYNEKGIVPRYRLEIKPLSDEEGTTYFVMRIYPLTPTRPCRTFQIGSERKILEFIPRVDSNPHRSENWIDASYLEKQLPERKHLQWMGENYPYS
jgi:hypothetical protein